MFRDLRSPCRAGGTGLTSIRNHGEMKEEPSATAGAVGCQRGVSPVVVSVSMGVSAATLRNASARVKVSPMAWSAS